MALPLPPSYLSLLTDHILSHLIFPSLGILSGEKSICFADILQESSSLACRQTSSMTSLCFVALLITGAEIKAKLVHWCKHFWKEFIVMWWMGWAHWEKDQTLLWMKLKSKLICIMVWDCALVQFRKHRRGCHKLSHRFGRLEIVEESYFKRGYFPYRSRGAVRDLIFFH